MPPKQRDSVPRPQGPSPGAHKSHASASPASRAKNSHQASTGASRQGSGRPHHSAVAPGGPRRPSGTLADSPLEDPLPKQVLRWRLGLNSMAEETRKLEAQAQRLHKATYGPPDPACVVEYATAALSLVQVEVCAELEQVVAATEQLEWGAVSVSVDTEAAGGPIAKQNGRGPPQLYGRPAGNGAPSTQQPHHHHHHHHQHRPPLKLLVSVRQRDARMLAADAVDTASGALGGEEGDSAAGGEGAGRVTAAALLEDESLATLQLQGMKPGLINCKGPLGCKPTDWVVLSTEPVTNSAMWGTDVRDAAADGGGGSGGNSQGNGSSSGQGQSQGQGGSRSSTGIVHVLGLVTGLVATGPHSSDAEVEVAWPEPGSDLHRLLFPEDAAAAAAAEGQEGGKGAQGSSGESSCSSDEEDLDDDVDEDAVEAAPGRVVAAPQQQWYFSIIGTGASSMRTFSALRGAKVRAGKQLRDAAYHAKMLKQQQQQLMQRAQQQQGAFLGRNGYPMPPQPTLPPPPPPPPSLLLSVLCPGPRILHGLDLQQVAAAFPHMGPYLGSVADYCTHRGRLNPSQVGAVQQVMAAATVALTERDQGLPTGHQVLLVQGPPGTGKTSTIATLLSLLVSSGNLSTLLVAPTNVAVQEVARRFLGLLHEARCPPRSEQQPAPHQVGRLRDVAILAKDEVVRARVGTGPEEDTNTSSTAGGSTHDSTLPASSSPTPMVAPRPEGPAYHLLEVCAETRAARLYVALMDPRDNVFTVAARLAWAFEGVGQEPGSDQVGRVLRDLGLLRHEALLLWDHMPAALVPRALQPGAQQHRPVTWAGQEGDDRDGGGGDGPPSPQRSLDDLLLDLAHTCQVARERLQQAAARVKAQRPGREREVDQLGFMGVLSREEGGLMAMFAAAQAAQALRRTGPAWAQSTLIKECESKSPDQAVGWLEKQVLAHARLVLCTVSMAGRRVLQQARQEQGGGGGGGRGPGGGGGGGRRPGFDVCVVDEASQLSEPQTAIILEAFPDLPVLTLVGDPKQLPCTVKSTAALKLGLGRSLMDRLVECSMHMHMLNTQYRMHPHISVWPSRTFYDSQLLDSPHVSERMRSGHLALLPLFTTLGPYRVVHVEGGAGEEMCASTSGTSLTGGGSRINRTEGELVARTVRALVTQFQGRRLALPWAHLQQQHKAGKSEVLTIGVISPYNGQVRLLSELLQDLLVQCGNGRVRKTKAPKDTTTDGTNGQQQQQQGGGGGAPQQASAAFPAPAAVPAPAPAPAAGRGSCGFSLEVRSVDGFQGREMDVVLVSTVRSNISGALGFLNDMRRLNVAITRGRHAVWLFGDTSTLRQGDEVWHQLVEDAWQRKALVDCRALEPLLPTIAPAPAPAPAGPVPVPTFSAFGPNRMVPQVNGSTGSTVARSQPEAEQQGAGEEVVAPARRAATGECVPVSAPPLDRDAARVHPGQEEDDDEPLESMVDLVRALALSDRG